MRSLLVAFTGLMLFAAGSAQAKIAITIDKNVQIPERAEIGVDLERDRQRYTVTEGGVVVIGKGQKVEP